MNMKKDEVIIETDPTMTRALKVAAIAAAVGTVAWAGVEVLWFGWTVVAMAASTVRRS